MLKKEEFFNYIKANIGGYLAPKYHDSEIILRPVVKSNDQNLTALIIRPPQDKISAVPCIYLDDYYTRYSNGAHLLDLLDEIAQCRNLYDSNLDAVDLKSIGHYSFAKTRLVIKMCDPELNKKLLQNKVHTMEGELAALYYVNIKSGNDADGMVAIDHSLLKIWDVSAVQLRKDAVCAELQRGYALYTMENILCSFSGIEKKKNLLDQAAETNIPPLPMPMFVLTRSDMNFGASAIMHDEIMDRACSVIGADKLYVLPSSIHEVLLLPVSDNADITMLTAMVKEINATQVAPEDLLSNKVQIYERHLHRLSIATDSDSEVCASA